MATGFNLPPGGQTPGAFEPRQPSEQVAARTRSAIDACLRNRRHGTAFAEYVAEPPRLSKGETILDAVTRLERRCRELRADLHRCESAPYPLSHARARLVETVERLAQAPNVSMLIELRYFAHLRSERARSPRTQAGGSHPDRTGSERCAQSHLAAPAFLHGCEQPRNGGPACCHSPTRGRALACRWRVSLGTARTLFRPCAPAYETRSAVATSKYPIGYIRKWWRRADPRL